MDAHAGISASRWARRPWLGDRVGVIAALAAVGLSVYVVVLVNGQRGGGVAACFAAIAMTVPIAYARRAPLATSVTVLIATVVNELAFGHLIRCGAALPAAFYLAYVAGNAAIGRIRSGALAAVIAAIVVQCVYDPRLGPAVALAMVPVGLVFFGAGLYVRTRADMVESLRDRTAQIREQREQTALLIVAADRARITAEIHTTLRDHLASIGDLVDAAVDGTAERIASFAAIELTGRKLLDSMRGMVGTLRDASTQPEPGLADLTDLLAGQTTANGRLSIVGAARALPASIELAGYRATEQVLTTLRDDPAASVEVSVHFSTDSLELRVAGSPAASSDLRRALSLARARVALYGGTVDLDDAAGRRTARIRLPLVTNHV
jgi:signal transduction histidine kinase